MPIFACAGTRIFATYTARMKAIRGERPYVTEFILMMAGLLLSGCATPIEGALEPPPSWIVENQSASCESMFGVYSDNGEPADGNAHSWLYNVVWPIQGSLVSIIERGVNVPPRGTFMTVTIHADAAGQVSFEAKDAAGLMQPLIPSDWMCESGALTTHVGLTPAGSTFSKNNQSESYLRLWKNADGALIAEQTVRSVSSRAVSASADYKPLARFYFRFRPESEG